MIKLVIFDWDGTLFDSIDTICHCMLEAAKLANAPNRTKEDIKHIIGLSLEKAVEVIWPEANQILKNTILENYKRLYVANDQTPPEAYNGVMETLNTLKKEGFLLAVATGKSRRGLNRVMSLTETEHYFLTSRCSDETLSKPDPLMLNEILSELDLLAHQAIMVGDTEYDLNMATNAGIKSIGVTYGAHSKTRLQACNPHAIIDDFPKLLTVLGQ